MFVFLRHNRTIGHHGFGTDPRLQFAPLETKLIDTAWLEPFSSGPILRTLFDPSAPNGPAFAFVRASAAEIDAARQLAEATEAAKQAAVKKEQDDAAGFFARLSSGQL